LAAGDGWNKQLEEKISTNSGHIAIEIMTGAMMPPLPFDAVVRLENVNVQTLNGETWIEISHPSPAGDQVREKGSDYIKVRFDSFKKHKAGCEPYYGFGKFGRF